MWERWVREEKATYLHNAQSTHLLTHPITPIPRRIGRPMLPTRHAIRAAITLRRCRLGAGLQFRRDVIRGPGNDFRSRGHPAREVGFEGLLIRIAGSDCIDVFAGLFIHDVIFEVDVGLIEYAGEAGAPG